ncbi:hypothetical protein [Microbacterium sp. NPDC058345]|uniref:hypothetical protein n=1 Tax=Microbacterium sp. NPDC058345 TaxID=3346455 RepID=UPI003660DA29
MTDSRMSHGDGALASAPGLQLIGTDSDAGLCVDGVCVLPSPPAVPAEKTD